MYAVIRSGGKQERVAEGQRVRVELLGEPVGAEVSLEPVLVVDGSTVLATPEQLAGTAVKAKVVGEEKGPKINAMTYKSKSNQRRRWGHRQHYATLEITAITAKATKPTRSSKAAKTAASAEHAESAEPADAE
jgi:large subunit ribosomal protein L21